MKRLVIIVVVVVVTVWGFIALKNAADKFGQYIAGSIVVQTK